MVAVASPSQVRRRAVAPPGGAKRSGAARFRYRPRTVRSPIEPLAYDSKLFGHGVARIVPARLAPEELAGALAEARAGGAHLVYWSVDPGDPASVAAARAAGGFHADTKTTFARPVPDPAPPVDPPAGFALASWAGRAATPELESLALQSGAFSRFAVDPQVPREVFERLYLTWLRKSLSGEMARDVVVALRDGRAAGFVTVGESDGAADIGLIAVDAAARGAGLGGALVRAALAWAREEGFATARVVTQGANLAACALYRRAGYDVEAVREVFHFR